MYSVVRLEVSPFILQVYSFVRLEVSPFTTDVSAVIDSITFTVFCLWHKH